MRVLRVSKNMKKAKLIIGGLAIVSFSVLISGIILSAPIVLGAGVAGCILMCGAYIALRRPTSTGLV